MPKKRKPMKPPVRVKPKRITTPGKPGDSGPGGAHPGRNRPKDPPKLKRDKKEG